MSPGISHLKFIWQHSRLSQWCSNVFWHLGPLVTQMKIMFRDRQSVFPFETLMLPPMLDAPLTPSPLVTPQCLIHLIWILTICWSKYVLQLLCNILKVRCEGLLCWLYLSSPYRQEWWNKTVFHRSLMLFLLVQTGLCLYLVLSDHARWLHPHLSQFNLEDGVSTLVAADSACRQHLRPQCECSEWWNGSDRGSSLG